MPVFLCSCDARAPATCYVSLWSTCMLDKCVTTRGTADYLPQLTLFNLSNFIYQCSQWCRKTKAQNKWTQNKSKQPLLRVLYIREWLCSLTIPNYITTTSTYLKTNITKIIMGYMYISHAITTFFIPLSIRLQNLEAILLFWKSPAYALPTCEFIFTLFDGSASLPICIVTFSQDSKHYLLWVRPLLELQSHHQFRYIQIINADV